MEGNDHGRTASSSAKPSRLSPLAEPFSSNRSNTALPPRHTSTSLDPCASMPKPLSDINLEDDPFQLASVFSHDFFDYGENSCFADYPSANAGSDFGFIPSAANESLLDYTELSSFGHGQASVSGNKSATLAYETLLELGKPAVTGSKPYVDNSEIVRGKCSDLIGRDNQLDAGLYSFSAVNSAKSPAFHSPKHNAFPAVVLESSNTSTTVPPLNPVLSKNVDFKGNCSVNNYVDLHHLLSGEGKGIHRDESPNDKGNEGKAGKALSSEGIGPLLSAKSDPLITLSNISDDFSLEHLRAIKDVSLARKLDENDSDLDSPCWKGTMASGQSPFGVSSSLSSDFVENEQETRNSLNPLAPQFFPRHAKTIVNSHVSECIGDDFSSFQKSDSSAVVSFSKGHGRVDEAGSKPSISNYGIADESSNDNHEVERAFALPNSESGSVLNAPVGLCKLLSTHPKIDVPTILNVMHEMSEMLVQNCSNDIDSLNEYKPDVIQHVINNLSMCIQQRAGGKTPISDITLTGTPYCPNKSTELQQVECSNTGFQVTRTNALAALHKLDYQNCYKGRKVNSHIFTERTLDSFSSRNGIDTEKSNDIIQVMGNTLRGNHLNSEGLDPEALVYKKLWFEAEAELRSLKYETCVLYTQLEMGGCKLDKYKVSGKLLARDIH